MNHDAGRILAIDVGAGTQDILIYEEGQPIENCVKLVLPSWTTGRCRTRFWAIKSWASKMDASGPMVTTRRVIDLLTNIVSPCSLKKLTPQPFNRIST